MNTELSFAELGLVRLLIRDIRIAMVLSISGQGVCSCRPMITQEPTPEDSLWFFSRVASPRIPIDVHTSEESRVQICYCDQNANRFVSVTGHAREIYARDTIETLCNPHLTEWFPCGVEDPDIALLQVRVERAEYLNTYTGEWSLLTLTAPGGEWRTGGRTIGSHCASPRLHGPR